MKTIVFLDRATIPSDISLPTPSFAHQWQEYQTTSPEQLLERLEVADIVITNKVVLDRATLSQLPRLKMVAIAATGMNNVDLVACEELGIAVANIQGYATRSVPEHVIGMIYALKRNLFAYHNDIHAGVWQESKQFCFFSQPIGDVAGTTLGVIGSGALGQATAALAKAIGMQVIFAERKGESQCRDGYLPFEEVLASSDVLTLHCPLTDATRNIIGDAELAAMKSSAILINTGRGGLVDENALVAALKAGIIAGAGVDVFTQEPADMSNPLLAAMETLPNLLLTPHVAWGSRSAITKLTEILIENIDAFVAGESKNRVI